MNATSSKKRQTEIVDGIFEEPPKKKARTQNPHQNPQRRAPPKKKAKAAETGPQYYQGYDFRVPLYGKDGKKKKGARAARSLVQKLNREQLLDIVEEYAGKDKRDSMSQFEKKRVAQWIEDVETIAIGGNVKKAQAQAAAEKAKERRKTIEAPAKKAQQPANREKLVPKSVKKHQHVTGGGANGVRKHKKPKKVDMARRLASPSPNPEFTEAFFNAYQDQLSGSEDEDEDESESSEEESGEELSEAEVEPESMHQGTEGSEIAAKAKEAGVHPLIVALGLGPDDKFNCTKIVHLPESGEYVIVTATSRKYKTTVHHSIHQTRVPDGSGRYQEEPLEDEIESEAE